MATAPDNKIYPDSKVIRRLSLWATDPQSPNKEQANMTFAVKGNNIEILVWTRNPNDKGKPPIRANMHLMQISALCQALEMVASESGKSMMDIPLKHARANPNDPTAAKEVYTQSTVRVTKNTEGIMSIGLFDYDETRSRILFPFVLDRWTGEISLNGNPLTTSQLSCMMAKSYAKILTEVAVEHAEITSQEENSQRYGKPQTGGRGASKQSNRSQDGGTDIYGDIIQF